VDNTPPSIPPQTLLPLDHSNTVFSSAQPLAVNVRDHGGSGLSASSVKFTATDDSGAVVHPNAPVSWSASTGWARTAPLAFQPGRVYRLEVRARDNAGNEAVVSHRAVGNGGGFLATSWAPAPSAGSIPPTPCTVSQEVDLATGTREAVCPDVTLHYDASTVAWGGSRHAGAGFVEHTASLEGAVVSASAAGVSVDLPAHRPGSAEWAPRTASLRFEAAESPAAAPVSALDLALGTLRTRVPAAWTGQVTLRMDPAPTTTSTAACADPSQSAASLPCIPDPVQHNYAVVLHEGADAQAAADRHEGSARAEVSFIDPVAGGPHYIGVLPPTSMPAVASDPDVRFVFRDLPQDSVDVGGTSCEDVYTRVRVIMSAHDVERRANVLTANTAACSQLVQPFSPATADSSAGACPPQSGTDYIHTSHTIQSAATTDKVWARASLNRMWLDCIRTYWVVPDAQTPRRHTSWANSGANWNHDRPEFYHVSWECGAATMCANAYSGFAAHVWSDSFQCPNFGWGRGEYDILTSVRTTGLGEWYVTTDKVGACNGHHSATDAKIGTVDKHFGGTDAGAMFACSRSLSEITYAC
jgi:hypothetical protein